MNLHRLQELRLREENQSSLIHCKYAWEAWTKRSFGAKDYLKRRGQPPEILCRMASKSPERQLWIYFTLFSHGLVEWDNMLRNVGRSPEVHCRKMNPSELILDIDRASEMEGNTTPSAGWYQTLWWCCLF